MSIMEALGLRSPAVLRSRLEVPVRRSFGPTVWFLKEPPQKKFKFNEMFQHRKSLHSWMEPACGQKRRV